MNAPVRSRSADGQSVQSPKQIGVSSISLIVPFIVCLISANVGAGDMVPASVQSDYSAKLSSVLDGQFFAGEMGPMGKGANIEGAWIFDQGMFVSKECEVCGFPKSPYWVRFAEDGIHFMSETQCPKTQATIVWQGIVKDGEVEGTFTWTKKRWYWTIEKEFWFKGKLADTQTAMSAP